MRVTKVTKNRKAVKRAASSSLKDSDCAYVFTGVADKKKSEMTVGIFEVNSGVDPSLYHSLLYRAYIDIRAKLMEKIISGEFRMPGVL